MHPHLCVHTMFTHGGQRTASLDQFFPVARGVMRIKFMPSADSRRLHLLSHPSAPTDASIFKLQVLIQLSLIRDISLTALCT